ncbi:MAG: DUF63 family protein [Candidatus Diapherotrites archaeon]|nr:DUF63 family protein [Candidatus Diapherotrites archaeon]
MADIFSEYFVRPALDPAYQGYNIVNTFVYGAILLGLSFFVIFPLLDKRGIKFDLRFALSLIPYILLGASLRAINEFKLLPFVNKTFNPLEFGFWTYTPGVWFFVFGVTIAGLIISRKLWKKNYYKSFTIFGVAVGSLPVVLCLFSFTNWLAFFLPLLFTAFTSIAIGFFTPLKKNLLQNRMNLLVLGGQLLDGFATAIAIAYFNFREQHPVSEAILNLNPWLFVLIKALLALVLVYYIDCAIKRENLASFAKLFIIILGFSTGLASVFKLGLA